MGGKAGGQGGVGRGHSLERKGRKAAGCELTAYQRLDQRAEQACVRERYRGRENS